jgi:hypothetical protein
MLKRSFGVASVALLSCAAAACSYSDMLAAPGTETVAVSAPATEATVAPVATTVAVATTAPPPPRSCTSNADCGHDHTGGLCMPKPETRELADAEDFLGRAMGLYDLSARLRDPQSSSGLRTIQGRAHADMLTYGSIASGRGGDGTNVDGQGTPLTTAQTQQMHQDAAWMQSGAVQAEMFIGQFAFAVSRPPLTTDARAVYSDLMGDGTGLHGEQIVRDLQTFLRDIEVAAAPVNKLITLREADGGPLTPKSCAGALLLYLGPVMKEIESARSRVEERLDPAAIPLLETGLTKVSQGHDLVGGDGTCLGAPGDTSGGAGTAH